MTSAVALDLSLDGAALTAALVDMPSVSGDEGVLADAVEAALRALGHLAVRRDGNVVIARTDLGRAERVVLAGHLDTVPIADNVPSRRDGDLLYGCGTTDMKAGVAVMLRIAATVPAPARDLTFVFYDCEEIEADRNGLGRLAAARAGGPGWRSRDAAGADERCGRGRLPGHAAGGGDGARASGTQRTVLAR